MGEGSNTDAPEAPDDEMQGLPDNASCAACQYSELLPPSPQLERQRICRRFPPTAVALPLMQGNSLVGFAIQSAPAPVADEFWCYEFDEREGAEIEPTGLLLPGKAS